MVDTHYSKLHDRDTAQDQNFVFSADNTVTIYLALALSFAKAVPRRRRAHDKRKTFKKVKTVKIACVVFKRLIGSASPPRSPVFWLRRRSDPLFALPVLAECTQSGNLHRWLEQGHASWTAQKRSLRQSMRTTSDRLVGVFLPYLCMLRFHGS